MKALSGILLIAGMIFATIVSYHLMAKVMPEWMTFWALGATFSYLGIITGALAELNK